MIANSTCRRLFSVAILGLLISAAASAQDVTIKSDADADKFNEPEQLKATPDHKSTLATVMAEAWTLGKATNLSIRRTAPLTGYWAKITFRRHL